MVDALPTETTGDLWENLTTDMTLMINIFSFRLFSERLNTDFPCKLHCKRIKYPQIQRL